jgi:TRAP-type C4-dicarboxylate transport system permease small subunit
MLEPMKERIHTALDAVYSGCIWTAGIAIAVMTLIIPWGIFARYVLGSGSQWPEPVAILLMVIFTFVGTAASYRAGAHIAVAMVTDRLPPQWQKACALVVHLLMFVMCIFMAVWGVELCIGTWNQSISEIPWMPVGLTYSPVPIGGLLTGLFVLEHIFYGSQARRAVVTFDQQIEEAHPINITPSQGAT